MSVTRKVMWSSMGWLLWGVVVRRPHTRTVCAYSAVWQEARDLAPGACRTWSSHAGLVASLCLGLIERLVGAGQHGVQGVLGAEPGGEADAQPTVQRMARGGSRMDALGHGLGILGAGFGQQHHEFFAAVAAQPGGAAQH